MQILTKLNRWRRAPVLYTGRLRRRLFGQDESWIALPRDHFAPGTWEWLALTENRYGGFKAGVTTGKCRGGDRMSPFYHGYGETYEEFLKPLLPRRQDRLIVVEIGILNGSGLAIWCDLFPHARVIGLDINLANFEGNRRALEAAGAFAENAPECYEIDQLDVQGSRKVLADVFSNQKVDMVVDDGLHTTESIRNTLRLMLPHLARPFVYFIEDNWDSFDTLAAEHPEFKWSQRGEMTVTEFV
jgi:hypothetical protein